MTSRNGPNHHRVFITSVWSVDCGRILGSDQILDEFHFTSVLPTTTDCQDLIKIIANLNLCNVISSVNFIILISLSQAITSSMQNRKINCKYKI